MLKNTTILIFLLMAFFAKAQVVINEIDPDTPSTDDKEFIELKSATPNFSLDGYVLVLYNGSPTSSTGNKSYYTIDLAGLTTDFNGIVVVGNDFVSPVPTRPMPISTIQNGPDAIALYQGTFDDFPDQTPVTATNLIDAIVYGNNAPNATTLINVLGVAGQVNEGLNGLATTQSIQRKPDGTYEVKAPTPGRNNDGSGIPYNGITISVPSTTYYEGQSFPITFTAQNPVSSNLSFSFTLANGTFNNQDFSGNLNVFIPTGSTTFSTTIQIIDDTIDDGDEYAKIVFGPLPIGYNRLNDYIQILVIDNDFTTANYGTPLNPTFGLVSSTAPTGYYDSLEGKAGAELRQAIQDIIADPNVVHAHNYGDIEYIIKAADQSPLNSNKVWLMYVEQERPKYKFQTSSSNVGFWNREHIFPQSRGGFANATSSTADGIDIWLPTNADDIAAGHADGHHIRAEDGPENSARSNKDYGLDDYNGPVGSQGSWHGDVARSLFYMAVRYNILSLVNGNPPDTTMFQLGDLNTLLTWNQSDPSDDFEMHRNNVVYQWQINRNPFIDYPTLADYIWGTNGGEVWNAPLSTTSFDAKQIVYYPNAAHDHFSVYGVDSGNLILYNISGAKVFESKFVQDERVNFNLPSGMYIIKIATKNGERIGKLAVN